MHETRETWDQFWKGKGIARTREIDVEREFRSFYWELLEARLLAIHGRIEGLRTIELGSGAGVMSLLLALRGARTTLLDRSGAALDSARELFRRHGAGGDFVEGDLLAPPPDLARGYDLTLSLGTGEHFAGDERRRFWETHWRLLDAPGLAFVSVPNAACPPYRLYAALSRALGFWEVGLEIPYHRSEVRRLLAEIGVGQADFAGSPLVNDCGYFLGGGAAKLGAAVFLTPARRGAWYARVDRWLKRWPRLGGPLDGAWGYSLVALIERQAASDTP